MLQRSQIFPGLIGFLLFNFQTFKTSFTLKMLDFPEIGYLASKLTSEECFQLYNMSGGRNLRVETLDFIREKRLTIPCVTLLSTWLMDPDESKKTFENVSLKLEEIGRQDLALHLNRSLIYRRNNTNSSGVKDLEDETMEKSVFRDERSQTFICPTESSEKKKIFWEIFLIILTILTVLFLCFCCCFCIYEKLRCTCNRTERNYCGNNEENEEKYCLCADKLRETSFEDYCTNKKEPSHFKRVFSNFKKYFSNRKEQKKEKLRYERFQKLKKKLQKMYLEHRKEILVNRQEERILNSLTEKERDELGETICEMRFFLDSDKETERLLLSGKHSGTFIIDMKNLHHPKITHSYLTNQGIKKWEPRDGFSSFSGEMTPRKTCSDCELGRKDREKKKHRKLNRRREHEKCLKNDREKKNSKHIALEETSEFIKCYTIESEQCSSIAKQDQRFINESEKSNFSTSGQSEISTFRSENPSEQYENPLNKIQSVTESKNNSKDVIKSKSMIELESIEVNTSPLSIQKEKTKTRDNNHTQGDYCNKKTCDKLTKKWTSSKSINACWPLVACNSKINTEKSDENLDRCDTESQFDFRKTCDELSLLVSHQMKRQSYPCKRKYCFLRRNLKQQAHDIKQCQFKQHYFRYYPNDDPPSCGVDRICRDTYDEFKLMRASPCEKKEIRQSIYKRRKEFLDQPCFSPRKKCFTYSPIGTM